MPAEVTYRVVSMEDPTNAGRTAATAELAKLVAGSLHRADCLMLEKTDWEERDGRMRPVRTIVIDAEKSRGQWQLGEPI